MFKTHPVCDAKYLLKVAMVASLTFAALVSMASAEVFVIETHYSTADCTGTDTIIKENIMAIGCLGLGDYFAMYSCSGTEATLNTYSDSSCTSQTSSTPYASTDCNTEGSSPGRTFSCAEREVVATQHIYSTDGCAESDKTGSFSRPGGCRVTGTSSSEKDELVSGNTLFMNTYYTKNCTGDLQVTFSKGCRDAGTCTASASAWFKMVVRGCSSSSLVRVELPLLLCFLIRLLI